MEVIRSTRSSTRSIRVAGAACSLAPPPKGLSYVLVDVYLRPCSFDRAENLYEASEVM
jgi:hypothetical protein